VRERETERTIETGVRVSAIARATLAAASSVVVIREWIGCSLKTKKFSKKFGHLDI